MEAKRYAEACAAYELAQRYDPGMATQFRLAQCYEKLGRLATAWRNYLEVADMAAKVGMQKRERYARKQADALRGRLSTLTIIPSAATAALEGLRGSVDGRSIAMTQWGKPLPVDGGSHQIVVTAANRKQWVRQVEVKPEGDALVLRVKRLAADRTALKDIDTLDPSPDETSVGSSQRLAGWIVGGVGLAGLVVGTVLGALAKTRYDDSSDFCQDDYCTAEGLEIRDNARSQGTAATVVFSVSAAALVTGVVLLLTAPSSDESAGEQAVGPGGPFRIDARVEEAGVQLFAVGTW